MNQVTLIPGDGIGPEICGAVCEIIDRSKAEIEWEEVKVPPLNTREDRDLVLEEIISSVRRNKVALKGPITTPSGSGYRSVTVAIRKELNLYANVRPIRSLPGLNSPFKNLDFIIIRENTEGSYSGVGHRIRDEFAENIRIITSFCSTRIAHFAFQFARKNDRTKITVVHKANILKETDGLFLDSVRSVAQKYPHIALEERIVDNMCMQLVQNPHQYEIILAPNLYGDILSDLGAGLIGGLGVVGGANYGEDIAVFEAVHGSAPDIAGQNIANPLALLFSACLMLDYLDKKEVASQIYQAALKALKEGKNLTPDLGGEAKTGELAESIMSKL